MLIIDDYTKLTWVVFMKEKFEAFENFKIVKTLYENQIDCKLKCLRCDKGWEFTSREFDDFCEEHGIKRYLSM